MDESPSFLIGQWVTVHTPRPPLLPGTRYQVMQVLPKSQGPQQYRIKAMSEAFERVIDEGALAALGDE